MFSCVSFSCNQTVLVWSLLRTSLARCPNRLLQLHSWCHRQDGWNSLPSLLLSFSVRPPHVVNFLTAQWSLDCHTCYMVADFSQGECSRDTFANCNPFYDLVLKVTHHPLHYNPLVTQGKPRPTAGETALGCKYL